MNEQYTISIIEVISDGKSDKHGFAEYHFKANVYHKKKTIGERDVYMIRDLPTIEEMSKFNYKFENRTMDVIMENSNNNSFTITKILSVDEKSV